MNAAHLRSAGFTLLELIITIAIAATLMMVATPNFITFQRNSELASAANGMLAAISAARTEAMKRNMPAVIAPTGTDWASGWRVFVDVDRNDVFSSGDILVNTHEALRSYFSVTGTGNAAGSAPFLKFDGSGYARTSSTIAFVGTDVTDVSAYSQTRYLVVALTGRARVCKPSGAVDPTCGPTSTN